jgi:hypothetical protein
MRRAIILFILLALPACKRRPPEEAAAAPPPAPRPAAAAPAEEVVDALTPPAVDLARRADTANGHPGGPSQPALDTAQGEAQSRVQACLDGLPAGAFPGGVARLGVRYVVGNEGKARDVAVDGSSDAAVLACARSGIEGASFPRFEGPGVPTAFMLTYSRPQPAGAPDGGRR